jgi:hypothetical protein
MKERNSGIHRSTYYLPLIRTYAQALLRFQKTKPIRGRTEDTPKWNNTSPTPTIPLGRREDVDTYSIRRLGDGSIQFINYRNPLLTFTPDNLIHITPRYGCMMESGMIERLLGINTWLDRKKIGIKLDDERHVLEVGKTLTLDCSGCEDVDGEIEPTLKLHAKETIYSYYVNRKAANNVRARYSDFSKYLHGFMQLRKEVIETNPSNRSHYNRSHWQEGDEVLRISLMEIADCVGYEYAEQIVWHAGLNSGKEKVWKPNVSGFRFIEDKPQGASCLNMYVLGSGASTKTHWERYQEQASEFLRLVENGQPDDTRTDNFYRATLTLLGLTLGYVHRTPRIGEDATVVIGVGTVMNMWNNIVMKFHSDEMLDKRALKPNQLPNDKYNRYVTIMPTQAEIDRVAERRKSVQEL